MLASVRATRPGWVKSLGMSKEEVGVLKRKGLTVTQTDQGYQIRAEGISPFMVERQFRTWSVQFEFEKGLLTRLVIDARE